MNKIQLKRYKKIGTEIAHLNQDIEDAQKWLDNCYIRRDFEGARETLKKIEDIYHEIGIRQVIREELLLPQSIKLENAITEIEDFMKDNSIVDDYEAFVEEYVAIYLTDNYNHTLFGFDWKVRGSTIYVSNIRWNQHQLLSHDLKCLIDGEISRIEIGDIVLIKNTSLENAICIYDQEEPNYQTLSLSEAIKWLKKHYYL